MPGTNDGIPHHNLDSLVTTFQERRSGEDAKTLAKAALEVLGVGQSMDGQVSGVLGVQAKHDHRIEKLEVEVVSLKRWNWLLVLAGISLVLQTGLSMWDRFAPPSRAEAQVRPLPPGDR